MDSFVLLLGGILLAGWLAMGLGHKQIEEGQIPPVRAAVTIIITLITCISLWQLELVSGMVLMIIWQVVLYAFALAWGKAAEYTSNYVANKLVTPIIGIIYLGGFIAIVLIDTILG